MLGSRRIIAALLIVLTAVCILLTSCGKKEEVPSPEVPSLMNCDIEHEPEFGGIYITITIDDFNRLGFEYGDSVDIIFSNGYELHDLPYYNGYYVDPGEALLIAYPGYDYIKAAINFGDDLWETAGPLTGTLQDLKALNDLWLIAGKEADEDLDEEDSASVFLNEKAKYLDVQKARDIHYPDEREKFPSDVAFANFRQFSMGSIAPGRIYRSASPCDNQHNRADYVDALIAGAGIGCILNLSDNVNKIEGYIGKDSFNSPYFLSLYDKGNVIPLALNANYTSDEFAMKVAGGFLQMTGNDGPYLVHCTEGKDRTGFVCMLIEALAGASYREMADDYMITYDNYYEITPTNQADKYEVILEKNFDTMLQFLVGDPDADLENTDFVPYARNYLISAGMTDDEIDAFLGCLSE